MEHPIELNERMQLVSQFIRDQQLAVVSSVWQGKPQAAVVVFSQKSDFELIFATFNTTRKYRNLKADPQIAAVIGWDTGITVQLEGVAAEVDLAELEDCKQIHLKKNPGSHIYANLDQQRYFKIHTHWLRYTDINQEPEWSFELDF